MPSRIHGLVGGRRGEGAGSRTGCPLARGRHAWVRASGRNGGFLSSSLAHGLPNGLERFPDEIEEIERPAHENFASIHEVIERYGIDTGWESRPDVILARQRHQTSWFPGAVRLNERFGYEAQILELDELLRLDPLARLHRGDSVPWRSRARSPGKVCEGLGAAATRLGVESRNERLCVASTQRQATFRCGLAGKGPSAGPRRAHQPGG